MHHCLFLKQCQFHHGTRVCIHHITKDFIIRSKIFDITLFPTSTYFLALMRIIKHVGLTFALTAMLAGVHSLNGMQPQHQHHHHHQQQPRSGVEDRRDALGSAPVVRSPTQCQYEDLAQPSAAAFSQSCALGGGGVGVGVGVGDAGGYYSSQHAARLTSSFLAASTASVMGGSGSLLSSMAPYASHPSSGTLQPPTVPYGRQPGTQAGHASFYGRQGSSYDALTPATNLFHNPFAFNGNGH
jgi:hypothetical protein